MREEQIRKIVEDRCEESEGVTLRGMIRDFYSTKMRSTAIMVYAWGAVFGALTVYSAARFFAATRTQEQILFAALVILAAHVFGLAKIFAWGMLHQNSIKRDLRRLELRLAELAETLNRK